MLTVCFNVQYLIWYMLFLSTFRFYKCISVVYSLQHILWFCVVKKKYSHYSFACVLSKTSGCTRPDERICTLLCFPPAQQEHECDIAVQQSVYLLHQWTENCVCWDQDSQFNISDGVVCHFCQSLHCLTAATQIPGAAGSSLMLTWIS